MQTIPHQGVRVETGPLQFGDDWPGLFIRGDNAFAHAMALQAVLDGRADQFSEARARSLVRLLKSCAARAQTPEQLKGEGR